MYEATPEEFMELSDCEEFYHVFMFSCLQVFMFSCFHVCKCSCFHVFMFLVAGNDVNDGVAFVVRMQGLPYRATESDIVSVYT